MACIIALTYVIVVCFELNLTATFIGIQYYPEIRLFLKKKKKKKKTYKARFKKFRAIEHTLTRNCRACGQLQKFCEHEKASTRLMFSS